MIMNAHHEAVPFVLPALPGGEGWRRILDTFEPEAPVRPHALDGDGLRAPHAGAHLLEEEALHPPEEPYEVPERSLVLFLLEPTGAGAS
jgi:hypothetical protein